MKNKPIKEWNADDQPREKLILKGIEALSNAELLAILINTGNKENSALDIAKELLNLTNNNLYKLSRLSYADIKAKIKGLGNAKAITICAALELGKRRQEQDIDEDMPLLYTKDFYKILKPLLEDKNIEEFYVIYLNNRNKLITTEKLSTGGLTSTVVDIRIVLKNALLKNAVKIVIAHNHPSGEANPSDIDRRITNNLKIACMQLDIQLLDHIIVTNNLCYSFLDNGIL